jgi:hypothetical protein
VRAIIDNARYGSTAEQIAQMFPIVALHVLRRVLVRAGLLH